MSDRIDIRIVLLAFMVAVSHLALVSHVTAHFEPALEECELCVSQAQPLAAIPAADSSASVPLVSNTPAPAPSMRTVGALFPVPYLQRAPPSTSP
jgi:hypothetical protein